MLLLGKQKSGGNFDILLPGAELGIFVWGGQVRC